jgi:hypothetical protein
MEGCVSATARCQRPTVSSVVGCQVFPPPPVSLKTVIKATSLFCSLIVVFLCEADIGFGRYKLAEGQGLGQLQRQQTYHGLPFIFLFHAWTSCNVLTFSPVNQLYYKQQNTCLLPIVAFPRF